jgi:hypothetical protein
MNGFIGVNKLGGKDLPGEKLFNLFLYNSFSNFILLAHFPFS